MDSSSNVAVRRSDSKGLSETILPLQKEKQAQPKAPKGPNGPLVISKANQGESYYHDGVAWRDLYDYRFENPNWATFDHTANFCMKALAVNAAPK